MVAALAAQSLPRGQCQHTGPFHHCETLAAVRRQDVRSAVLQSSSTMTKTYNDHCNDNRNVDFVG